MTGLQERIRSAAAGPSPRRSRKEWVEPTLEDFAPGVVLCFDQTVTKTGWCVLVRDEMLHIRGGGVILSPQIEGVKGFEETLQRSVKMDRYIAQTVDALAWSLTDIVHEMPAIMGYRIESSLMAAMAIRTAAVRSARGVDLTMVSKMSVGPVLVHPDLDRLSKAEIKNSVNRLIPNWCRVTERWTQDVSDAAALGLTHLWRKQHAND